MTSTQSSGKPFFFFFFLGKHRGLFSGTLSSHLMMDAQELVKVFSQYINPLFTSMVMVEGLELVLFYIQNNRQTHFFYCIKETSDLKLNVPAPS